MKLKPCPFCGCEKVYKSTSRFETVTCGQCYATGPFADGRIAKQNQAWNKRVLKRKVKK